MFRRGERSLLALWRRPRRAFERLGLCCVAVANAFLGLFVLLSVRLERSFCVGSDIR